ncbi:MAG TPA: hypothetical protein VL126_05840, partial [Bacteroidota bacterium]|nr:hypothetical protein [Bacteroidota bacterium]
SSRATRDAGGGPLPWKVRRVFVEGDSARGMTPVNADRPHPYWKKTYFRIASEAWSAYTSLRLRLFERRASPVHWYKEIVPARGPASHSLLGGEPHVSGDLSPVKRAVELAVSLARRNERANCLTAVADALARIEKLLLVKRNRLDGLALRLLARWNECLESFRCCVDDISADIVQSDSIMAERQLFFLRIKAVHLPSPVKETEIVFPTASDTAWVINESRQNHFPLSLPDEFRVLTPSKLPLNYPPSLSGLGSSEMRVTVPYFIFHKDADRARNFAYRRELSLKVAPGRAVEVLTPVVRRAPGEEVRFRIYNITRQGLKGEAQVKDSVIADSRTSIVLERKDQTAVCTIPLLWQSPATGGDHLSDIRLGRTSVGRFLVREIDCRVDSTATLALASGIPDGIIASSLERLHVPWVRLDSAALRSRAWDTCATIVIDRNAIALRPDLRAVMGDVRAWVARGGHLIVFPQHESRSVADRAFPEFRFEDDMTPPQESVELLQEHFGLFPNHLDATDWQNWLVSRSSDRIVLAGDIKTEVIARSTKGQTALLLRIPLGNGNMTVVTLDFNHQLETLHPGACRIFANMLSH